MTWATTTLSTGLTLKQIEREIMELSKQYTPNSTIIMPSSGYNADVSAEDYAILNVGDLLTVEDTKGIDYVYVLSKEDDNEIGLSTPFDCSGVSTYTYQTWQEKITLAKVMIQSQLENYLSSSGYKVDEDSGDNLIDLIANPEIFAYASDFLTLNLIYSDLELGGSVMEIFDKKKMFYYDRYQDEMNVKLKQINIDSDLDGDADQYRITIAKISRLTR